MERNLVQKEMGRERVREQGGNNEKSAERWEGEDKGDHKGRR